MELKYKIYNKLNDNYFYSGQKEMRESREYLMMKF